MYNIQLLKCGASLHCPSRAGTEHTVVTGSVTLYTVSLKISTMSPPQSFSRLQKYIQWNLGVRPPTHADCYKLVVCINKK